MGRHLRAAPRLLVRRLVGWDVRGVVAVLALVGLACRPMAHLKRTLQHHQGSASSQRIAAANHRRSQAAEAAASKAAAVRVRAPEGSWGPGTRRAVVIAEQRSGSTYLSSALSSHAWGAGFFTFNEPMGPQELLPQGWTREQIFAAFGWNSEVAWPLYEQMLWNAFNVSAQFHAEGFPGQPAEVVGFKIMDNQLPYPLWPRFVSWCRQHGVRVVHLFRVNAIEGYLSHKDADETGQFHSFEQPAGGAQGNALTHTIDQQNLANSWTWHACKGQTAERYLGRLPREQRLLLPYERLNGEEGALDDTLRFLGLGPRAAVAKDIVRGSRNWVKLLVPHKLAEGRRCSARIDNWQQLAEWYAGSLELDLCEEALHVSEEAGWEEAARTVMAGFHEQGSWVQWTCDMDSMFPHCPGEWAQSTVDGCVSNMLAASDKRVRRSA